MRTNDHISLLWSLLAAARELGPCKGTGACTVFVILLSIFALTPAPIRAYSRLLPHTPAHADARISAGE